MPIKTKKKWTRSRVTKRNGGVQDGSFAEIPDAKTQAFVNELLAFAKHIFEQSYTVKVDDISDEMIALGGTDNQRSRGGTGSYERSRDLITS